MSFDVEPADLRAFARKLQQAGSDAADARTYVHAHGSFSFHQAGIIGTLSGAHTEWMKQLDEMLRHLTALTHSSSGALLDAARDYEQTDRKSAAKVDSSYRESPRPQNRHD